MNNFKILNRLIKAYFPRTPAYTFNGKEIKWLQASFCFVVMANNGGNQIERLY